MNHSFTPGAPVLHYPLFLSYGRKDADGLASRLVVDLPANGYQPWRDTRELTPGPAWEEQIERAIQDSKVFLALLSPHSVRRESTLAQPDRKASSPAGGRVEVDDSVCLDEIACARYVEHIPIVPAMAAPCRPPLSLSRLEYVDFAGWQDEATYRKALARLLDGLAQAVKGIVPERRWVARLDPLDFSTFLAEKRRRFTGRDWLFSRVERRLQETTQRALLIVGGAGVGKSAFVAEFVHQNPDGRIIACHCCRSGIPRTLEPGRFVRSIAAMIASQIPAYADAIDSSSVADVLSPAKSDDSPESALELGVIDVLHTLTPPESVRVVVIDALDEALTMERTPGQSSITIVDLLMNRTSRFPAWLKLVATTRNEAAVLTRLRGLVTEEINAEEKENRKDVSDFIDARLGEPAVAQLLAQGGRSREAISKTLVEKANGNFLYATHALDALATGPGALDLLGSLPPTLFGLYEEFFRRKFPTEQAFTPLKGVLETLVAALDPLTLDDLALASALDAQVALPPLLQSISSFLRRERARGEYALDHKSIADWLTDTERAGSTYYVSAYAGHRRLALALWNAYVEDATALSRYGLTHLVDHETVFTRSGPAAERQAAALRLAEFALDATVLKKQTDCPLDALHALLVATEAASRTGGPHRLPLTFGTALGLVGFRRDRLDPSRLFGLAAIGHLDKVERELELFSVDTAWRDAALLTAILVASDAHPKEAAEARTRMTIAPVTELALVERIDAALAQRTPNRPPPLMQPMSDSEAEAILLEIGGMDLEGRSGYARRSLVAPSHEAMSRAERGDKEAAVFMSEIHGPRLVAYVLQRPRLWAAAMDPVQEYIDLQAANSYRLYRNGSLYGILRAVLAHTDEAWVRRTLQKLVTSALAGGEPVFDEGVAIALDAWKAEGGDRTDLDQRIGATAAEVGTLSNVREYGDSWSHHKRRVAALLEAGVLVVRDPMIGARLPQFEAIPPGFAGTGAPGWLTVAESLHLAGRPWPKVWSALLEARGAAHNVQDASFCLKTTSRVNAMIDIWWGTPVAPIAIDVRQVVPAFVADLFTAAFSAKHIAGWTYPGRLDRHTRELPQWALRINTVDDLALAYQVPRSRLLELNPGLQTNGASLLPDTRLPDAEFTPLLAARLSAAVLGDMTLMPRERLTLIQSLVPAAVSNPTALDSVLGRLLIAAGPLDTPTIDRLWQIVRAAAPVNRKPADPHLAARGYRT